MKPTLGLGTIATAAAATLLAAGCGSSTTSTITLAPTSPPGAAAATTAPPPAATATATTSGVAPSCAPASGGSPSAVADLASVDVSHQSGADVLVFTFTASGGGTLTNLPAWMLTPQPAPTFQLDPSGLSETLSGAAGLKVVFHGATGYDISLTPPVRTYLGSTHLTPKLGEILDVSELGDFERVLSWGVGLATARCPSVSQTPTTLTIKLPASS